MTIGQKIVKVAWDVILPFFLIVAIPAQNYEVFGMKWLGILCFVCAVIDITNSILQYIDGEFWNRKDNGRI